MSISKKKIAASTTAVVIAAALLLSGTFAWQSISQTALNEASDAVNPGGRLHDDFNGENKDVYVENFAKDKIYARVRLDEYFEIIQNKGTSAETLHSIAGKRDADTGEITSWTTHKFGGDNATDEYWSWSTGGSTTYMPTFNKNKDSLAADINGTYSGLDGIVTDDADDDRYTDYVEYADGETKEDDEIYDADTNTTDEVGDDFENLTTYENAGNIVTVSEEHTAKETLDATLISMDEWINDYNSQPGEYWVYDTDGWVYWAQAIEPDTATGLLLDGIELTGALDDSWYYAINVVAQFITADDLGKTDGTGFYNTSEGTAPTDDALALLEAIGVDTSGEVADDEDVAETVYLELNWNENAEVNAKHGDNIVLSINESDEAEYGEPDFSSVTVTDAYGEELSSDAYTYNSETHTLVILDETITEVTVRDGSSNYAGTVILTQSDDGGNGENENVNTIQVSHDGSDTVSGGEWIVFGADVYDENGAIIASTDNVTFSLADQDGNPVNQDGVSATSLGLFTTTYMDGNDLFIADDIMNTDISKLVITAEYTDESTGNSYSGEYTLTVEGNDSPLSFTLNRNGVVNPHYVDSTYQVFTYDADEEQFDFDATLNGGPADVKWTLEEGSMYTVSEEIDGYVYALADGNWENLVVGTQIAKINTSTGEFSMLIDEEIERSLFMEITATTTDGSYTKTETLFIRRLYVNAYLYDMQYSNSELKPHQSVYTKGQENTFTLSAEMTVDGEEIAQADLATKLTNWKLYEAQYFVTEDSVEISTSDYEIKNNGDGTWTLTISENVTANNLLLNAQYDYGSSTSDQSDGIYDLTYDFVEASIATDDEQDVDRLVIENDNADEYEVYTSGERKKISLNAYAYAGDDSVNSGKIYWYLTDDEGNAVSNAYLVYDENNTFSAEVWILGETAETLKVTASYQAEEGGLQQETSYYIYEENSEPTAE